MVYKLTPEILEQLGFKKNSSVTLNNRYPFPTADAISWSVNDILIELVNENQFLISNPAVDKALQIYNARDIYEYFDACSVPYTQQMVEYANK
ncbi:hypothetical protein QNI19_25105 [Cytophagaceae bacterium DM2B3-1]|uniref:Uncharacterized protein n=1 Tax=Xanthocytophaga flava TaxID=3048013 RepID=A0ABT7CRC4_9BACT|nr:hypothetical protein [Xanthocytophaga flavus]MDJ1496241.1 hypothetical protein [Xanthocytophaga flavus]